MAMFSFSFLWRSTIWKSGTFCPRVSRQRNQRTFIFLLSGLVKHETYWQMLKVDISCPATSFQFVSTFNDSGGFYFLKGTQKFFWMSRNKQKILWHLVSWNNHVLWIINHDMKFIFCGTSIFAHQWNSRHTLLFKYSIPFFLFPVFPLISKSVKPTILSFNQIVPSQDRRRQSWTLKNNNGWIY